MLIVIISDINFFKDKVKFIIRLGIQLEKISILRVLKKKTWTPPRFLHRGPKKAVEHDSDIHFDPT